MKITTYKKANFKVAGVQAYERYMFNEFVGYSYKERKYQLSQKRTVKGKIETRERFAGWGYGHFSRDRKENGQFENWSDWATYHKNFVNEI